MIAGRADESQLLVPKATIGDEAQAQSQLRVVAKFAVRVQRQVVGEQIDLRLHQPPHALRQPARQPPVLAAPEKTMVNEQCVSAGVDGRVDQSRLPSRRDDEPQFARALDLQTVRPIILEAVRLQQRLQAGLDIAPAGGPFGMHLMHWSSGTHVAAHCLPSPLSRHLAALFTVPP
jgi:hypothetical protein